MSETANTSAILQTYSVKTKKPMGSPRLLPNVYCCSYIKRDSVAKKGQAVQMKLEIHFSQMPTSHRSLKFIQKWVDFINSFGLDIELKKIDKMNYQAVMMEEVNELNFFYLFNLNLVRYLWSTKYSKFPVQIFKLREDPKLKKLTNWEIFQLAHHLYSIKHISDMSPVHATDSQNVYHITSEKFLERRLRENLGSNLQTFNIPWKNGKMADTFANLSQMRTKKDYIGIYNLLSTKANKIPEYSHATCTNNKGFEDQLNVNANYMIIRELKAIIKVKNKNHRHKLYKKDRFKLI